MLLGTRASERTGGRLIPLLLAGFSLVVVAVNLRPAITAVSPLLGQLQAETGLSSSAAGLLTSLPLFCCVLFASFAPRLGRRIGLATAIAGVLVLLVAGLVLRLVPSMLGLFGGTVLIGIAVAGGNVLVPALIKRDHPHRLGLMTGLYTMSLNIGPAAAAGLTVPLQQATGLGWRGTLALWAVPVVFALVVWAPRLRGDRRGGGGGPANVLGIWRQPLAWSVTVFFGVLTLFFYTTSAWLPKLFVDNGMTPARAGAMLSVVSLVAIPFALLAPILGARTRDQVWLTTLGAALLAGGLLGVLLAPAQGTVLWMVLLGVGQGVATGTCFSLILLRSPDPHRAAQLGGMTQTVGYTLSTTGPLGAGVLHDLTGSWAAPVGMLLVLVLVQLLAGLHAGRDKLLE
ncbi:CynX/NimT family MFS transporter [Amycolatopsis nigrescens]|uniref:CynX/NimT family MFS transporter n=1 Tax=Amycolatopsis nigrescens TaxID=381445 RepID=UPI0003648FA7|nr:MFS transporter [Amycolatopsis nigrescens]